MAGLLGAAAAAARMMRPPTSRAAALPVNPNPTAPIAASTTAPARSTLAPKPVLGRPSQSKGTTTTK